jgi:hypothetical protein
VPFVNGQAYFPNPVLNSGTSLAPVYRQVFRLVLNMGGLANSGTTIMTHNIPITNTYSFTRIYATASDQTGFNYIPIPYADTTATTNNISIAVTLTDVIITTGSNRTNFTVVYAVLEYIIS